jgi:hypothetical protein
MPTTAKTGTKQSKAATPDPQPDVPDQSGFLPRRIDADGVTTELHGKTWVKVD